MARIAVIGLGLFGRNLASLLAEGGAEVLAIDWRKENVDAVRDEVAVAVCLDSTDEQALLAQGIDNVDAAVVGIGADFEHSALTTVMLKQLGVPRVISRATSRVRADILRRIGADAVINPEEEAAERWSNRLLAPAVLERFALAEGYSLAQVAAPKSFWGKTLKQLDLSKKHKVLVVAVRRTAAEQTDGDKGPRQLVVSAPGPDTAVEEGDELMLIGSDEAIANLPRK